MRNMATIKKKNKCLRCGICCIAIGLANSKTYYFKNKYNEADFVFKIWKRISKKTALNRMNRARRKTKRDRMLSIKDLNGFYYECIHFDKRKKMCRIHESKPEICKNYPYYEKRYGSNVNDMLHGSFCGYWKEG